MSSIDEVINRSRQSGTFTERRRFTVARGRAIQKMRQFALVDPHYYILELIQSAVANGATYIDIQADRKTTALSYVGGSFREMELAQLFDFLFASKDDVEHGPIRQLALGVNALMVFEPDEIVIETGDGTLKGTTRVVIRGGDDVVDVGTPDQALKGTYVRATGLKRGKARRSALKVIDGHPREYHAVENRCITAPVPILFNHDPLFGYTSQRTPESLYGFRRTVTFDEGDLYGTIGIATRRSGAVFRLITHGVWIQSVRREVEDMKGGEAFLGGVVTFDRLRKTADHSSIVEDERFEEMWLRLQPYINQLVSNQDSGVQYNVRTLGGEELEPREVLELVRNFETIVVVGPQAVIKPEYNERAKKIGDSLEAPVVSVPASRVDSLRALAGRDVEFVRPDLDDQMQLDFYTRAEDPLPATPWLVAPVNLGTLPLFDVAQRLPWPKNEPPSNVETVDDPKTNQLLAVSTLRQAVWLLESKVEVGQSPLDWKWAVLDPLGDSIRARVYTPQRLGVEELEHNVEVRAASRVVWSTRDERVAPGQVLVIDVADLAPKTLWQPPRGGGVPVAQTVAELVISRRLNRLEEAANAGLRAALRAEIEPASSAARLVLSALTSRLVRRIQTGEQGRKVVFSLIDPKIDTAVLEIELLKTLSGDGVSLKGLEALMEECHGLVYGVRSDVAPDLEGLDRSKILDLDAVQEQMLIGLVGPSAYVRVDRRDVLAQCEGVMCRDVAVGLRSYPDFPLLVEGPGVDALLAGSKQQQLQAVQTLVEQLIGVISEEAKSWDGQENRRQAWRHLQYFALRRRQFEWGQHVGDAVDHLPLFAISGGRTATAGQLVRVLENQGQLEMLDGWALGAGELTFARAYQCAVDDEKLLPFSLTMNPFVLQVLGEQVRGAAEYHLSQKEVEALGETEVEMMLESVIFDDDEAQGVVGVPKIPVERPAVVVFSANKREVVLAEELGELFGVVGKVRLRRQESREEDAISGKLHRAATDVLSHLLTRLPALSVSEPESFERALEVLLSYSGSKMQLTCRPDLSVDVDVFDSLAREILHTPIFAARQGVPLSAMALVREFQSQAWKALSANRELTFVPTMLADDQPAALTRFVERHLNLEAIHRPAAAAFEAPQAKISAEGEQQARCAGATVEYWLNQLRADEDHRKFEVVLEQQDLFADGKEFCQLRAGMAYPAGFSLHVNQRHWLFRWLSREGDKTPEPIAWALLAAYAHINNVQEPVTNEHELIFQQRVANALHEGRLKMV